MNIVDKNEYFEKIRSCPNIILYGIGGKARQSLDLLQSLEIYPVVACDKNPELWGGIISIGSTKIEICSFESVREKYKKYTILLTVSIKNAVEIRKELIKSGEKNPIYHLCNPYKVDFELSEPKDNEKIKEIYESWSDMLSQELFVQNYNYKLTGNMLELYTKTDGDTFFDDELVLRREDHIYIDVGVYTGDTICKFLEYTRGKYQQIVGFEPDPGNYKAALSFVKYGRVKNCIIENVALGNKQEKKSFFTVGNDNNNNYDSPNFYVDIEKIADNTTIKGDLIGEKTLQLDVDILDNVLAGIKPTIIKINALAADIPILQGASNILQNCRPIIIMEWGTRPEYLEELITFIKNIKSDYKFYLRQKNIFGDSKTIFYAV